MNKVISGTKAMSMNRATRRILGKLNKVKIPGSSRPTRKNQNSKV